MADDLGKGRLHVLWRRRQQGLSDKYLETENHALRTGISDQHGKLEYGYDQRGTGRSEKVCVKPSGLLDIDGKLYLSMESQNYEDNPYFGRQHNLYGWILRSDNGEKTFDAAATETEFFTGRLASCHFLQFGRGYEGAAP